ncbi:hypothetical protein EGI22_20890 [Lacihabitans sp. LS3-19]|uniref:hypothetical protein n=1 Tax=Lacihabitans sp. LS3-19 TaxID=2487335 RepID=UPI0020CF8BE0|nr:hypothetical protein [Lacihabitans sp. LS3-19]MCP9770371.1 hypothetical protein [Lacihabitans sp. LS3-19]
MGKLRIKLKYKSFEIELEGEEETVQAEFKDIKQNGLGNVVNGVDMSEANYIIETNPRQIEQVSSSNGETIKIASPTNLPSLKDVIMKQLPSAETEWILVYAFFASDGGSKYFTTKNILELYESSKRKTNSRKANLSNNIKALFGKGYFSALNDDEYILTDDGKHEATEILTRKHSSTIAKVKPTSKSSKKTESVDTIKSGKKSAGPNKFEVLKDINFRPSGKTSLLDFVKTYDIKSNADRIVVIIQYLNEILGIKPVTGNHIYSGFWELKCKIPTAFYQIITNTKTREKFLDFTKISDIKLSIQGQNHVRLDMVKK